MKALQSMQTSVMVMQETLHSVKQDLQEFRLDLRCNQEAKGVDNVDTTVILATKRILTKLRK